MMRCFVICMPHQIQLRLRNREGLDGHGMWHTWLRKEMHIGFWWRIFKENHCFKDVGVTVRKILKLVLKETGLGDVDCFLFCMGVKLGLSR